MATRLARKLTGRIEAQRGAEIERSAQIKARQEQKKEESVSMEAVLGRSAFDLLRTAEVFESSQRPSFSKTVKSIGRRLLGQEMQAPAEIQVGTVARPFLGGSAQLWEYRITLPPDLTDYIDEHSIVQGWALGFSKSMPRPYGWEYCTIYRTAQEGHSVQIDEEYIYKVTAIKSESSGDTAYDSIITSFTDGQRDDALITAGNGSAEHALALINQARNALIRVGKLK